MSNGWTGGQYSVLRAACGLWLCATFARLLAEASSGVSALLLAGAVLLSLLVALGLYDREAALTLSVGYLYSNTFSVWPDALPLLLFGGLLPLLHASLPTAPYGSWAARGRVDPGNGWQVPPTVFGTAWTLLALAYTAAGLLKLGSLTAETCPLVWAETGLELAYAPLALSGRVRPWLWAAMLAVHLARSASGAFADFYVGMLFVHGFTFDPAWVPAKQATATETIFYDGLCGLCHRSIRFVLSEDRSGTAFRFAPLQGETFQTTVPPEVRAQLPDSLIVRTGDGQLLQRSRAIRHIAVRLGGLWRVLGILAGLIPVALADAAYAGVARIRHRLFQKPSDACPVLPPPLRGQFDW